MSELILIAALSDNNVIGKDGKIPWHISEDLKRFKKLTLYNPIIMGRKTYESIGKPLEDRINVVLTSNYDYHPKGVLTRPSLDHALYDLRNYDQIFVIGGQKVYETALPLADKLELTRVHQEVKGDTYFPEINYNKWMKKEEINKEGFSFVTYIKYPAK
tara:strand:- start:76 stop:552 length:477 start_codon:yes stop_codon:yes gene_type:complete